MVVKLLDYTQLSVADTAISKCYGKEPYTDLEKQQSRINRVANVSKHSSTIEHLVYCFDIDGISRAVLQELARHRIASYTVKSTRYTLKELRDEEPIIMCDNRGVWKPNDTLLNRFCVVPDDISAKEYIAEGLSNLQRILQEGVSNDIAKYCLPEAYKTALVMTINARALQNFLSLRTDSHALWEIQDLARAMYEVVPDEHKFLFENCVKNKD